MTISGSGNFLAYIGNTTKGRFDVWVKQEKDSCIIPPPNLTMKYTGCRKPEEALCAANSTELVEKIKKERFSEAEMCTLLRFYFFTRGNKEMNNINLTPRIGNTTFIGDLRLQEEPKYESRFVNFYHKGELLWYPTLEEYYNRKTVNYTLHNDSSKMVYIWISKDVVQNLFKGVQTHGMLCYTITPEKLGPGNPGLNISCSKGVCVGRLVPELEDKYPNQYMDLDIYSLETPDVTFEKNLAVLKFCAVMFIYIRNPMDKMPNSTVIAKLDGSLDIRIKIFMKDSLLCGEVVAFEPYLENVDTTIHDFDVGFSRFFKIFK
ncbi:uncharacterized protein T19C3.5-like [Saccostrea cucullata]|uniref:uncharacterized protein T19C3.5-like n=1 Tax=Saccostrea cuccullata TaxID=36930 RepID=UPI002ED14BF7